MTQYFCTGFEMVMLRGYDSWDIQYQLGCHSLHTYGRVSQTCLLLIIHAQDLELEGCFLNQYHKYVQHFIPLLLKGYSVPEVRKSWILISRRHRFRCEPSSKFSGRAGVHAISANV